MPYNNWRLAENEQRLRDAAAQSTSIAGICKILGLRPLGGNIATIKVHITRLDIDTSHHTGQAWNRGKFKGKDYAKNGSWRKHLLRTRGYQCSECKRTEWNGQPIPLELEHIDGNRYNYEEENLTLLCCNCHALTSTWRNRKRGSVSQLVEESGLNPVK